MKLRHLLPLTALLCAVEPGAAHANGRFPLAQQLVEDPSDDDRLVLRATFGLVVSPDRGKTWNWVCEASVGYGGVEDPSLGVTLSGAILAGIFDGLRRSSDGGCNFSFPTPDLISRYAVDLTVSPVDRTRVLVLNSSGKGGGTFETQVWESLDEGLTFAQLGDDLPTDLLALTLDPAPSDPDRIYVSGIGPGGAAVFLRSEDRGASWQSFPVPGSDIQSSPFIGAVHPQDPDVVYVRTAGSGINRLLITRDGGDSFEELFAAEGRMLGFALAPNGETVLLGYGDPKGGTPINPDTLGLYRAATSDHQFERVHTGPINCLTWTTRGLYACGSQFVQGFELGFTTDPFFPATDPAPFQTLLTLTTVTGPIACSSDSTSAICELEWPALCEGLGKCLPDADAGPDAGSGGATAAPRGDEGCGCRTTGDSSRGLVAGLGILALGLLRRARRRA